MPLRERRGQQRLYIWPMDPKLTSPPLTQTPFRTSRFAHFLFLVPHLSCSQSSLRRLKQRLERGRSLHTPLWRLYIKRKKSPRQQRNKSLSPVPGKRRQRRLTNTVYSCLGKASKRPSRKTSRDNPRVWWGISGRR